MVSVNAIYTWKHDIEDKNENICSQLSDKLDQKIDFGIMSSDRQPGSVRVKISTKYSKCTKINPWKNLVFNWLQKRIDMFIYVKFHVCQSFWCFGRAAWQNEK